MLNDLDMIDWVGLKQPETPEWIRDLLSEKEDVRNLSFEQLVQDTYIYERLDYANAVLPFLIEILSTPNSHSDKAQLLVFINALYINMAYYKRQKKDYYVEKIMKDIEASMEIFKKVKSESDKPDVKEEAERLIKTILTKDGEL